MKARLTAVLDWDCADVGPAGINLGSTHRFFAVLRVDDASDSS
jgi:hypothetical protein